VWGERKSRAAVSRLVSPPQPRGPAHLRPVPLRLRQRRRRGRSQTPVRDLRGTGSGQTPVPGSGSQPQPLDRGEGRHQESRPGPAADHFRRTGQHRSLGHRERLLQTTTRQPRHHRDQRDQGTRSRPHYRQRLARGRRNRPDLRETSCLNLTAAGWTRSLPRATLRLWPSWRPI
jgi:hypothetical protein